MQTTWNAASVKRHYVRLVAVGILAAATVPGFAAGPPKPVVLQGHTKAVTALAWATDGRTLATAADDRTIRVWDPATGRQTTLLREIAREGYGGPVVAFNPNLKVAAINYWGKVTILSVEDGKERVEINPLVAPALNPELRKSAFRPDVFAMAFSPNGKRLATAGSVAAIGGRHGLPGGTVAVWDAETGKMMHRSELLSTAAGSVVWSPDGMRFAAGTNGAGGELPEPGEVHVWDAEDGHVLHRFQVKRDVEAGEWASAGDVVFSPDGKKIAVPVTAGSRGAPAGLLIPEAAATVRSWDLTTGQATLLVRGLETSVERVAFSPNGKRLATAGRERVVRIWDVESGKQLEALPVPERASVVAFSPDGASLAAGVHDGSVQTWTLRFP